MTAQIVGYEDHIPASATVALGAVNAVGDDGDECFVCGQEWPCGKTVAYNDGLNDGALNERARIIGALRDAAKQAGDGVDIGTFRTADRYTSLADKIQRGEL